MTTEIKYRSARQKACTNLMNEFDRFMKSFQNGQTHSLGKDDAFTYGKMLQIKYRLNIVWQIP